ncbi:hypothetical protein JI58_07620 [Marinosulfonomonas sp. PRT-SC04]|nr:hypothetical protein JI58_07620 [Marinosulfonomonas sp. PRT-SC04]
MEHITCPPNRHQLLRNQQLGSAREIIRHPAPYSAGTIDAAMKTIAALSPHIDAAMATAALASRKVAA